MKVYVLEVGCYESRYIRGVYATPEAAMAAHTPKPGLLPRGSSRSSVPFSYEWRKDDRGESWSFDADWDDAADISMYELDGAA